jgi:hypothetical protein
LRSSIGGNLTLHIGTSMPRFFLGCYEAKSVFCSQIAFENAHFCRVALCPLRAGGEQGDARVVAPKVVL